MLRKWIVCFLEPQESGCGVSPQTVLEASRVR